MNDNLPKDSSALRNLRRLIWLYFWVLVFEGALRKWVVPQLSNPLLIVRDPVVLAIYLLAIRARIFPFNAWVIAVGVIGALSFALTFVVLWPYLPPSRIALVAGFGFRSNYLHLPLIFILPRVWRAEDVKRFGWWLLLLLLPMTLLMIGQFRSAPEAFLNRTPGGEGEMMLAALGKVRTAGTFSFVIGVVSYFALATAYLIWAALQRAAYRQWLLFAAAGALVIGISVSGSRSVVGAVGVVIAFVGLIFLLRPEAVNRLGRVLVVVVLLGWGITHVPVFREGLNVLTTRFNDVAEANETSVSATLVGRIVHEQTESLYVLIKAPFLGYGLGLGTNGGARFLVGRAAFLLSESEWQRLFLESGPVLGLAFVLWRCALVVSVGLLCCRSVHRHANVLPLLIFSAGFMPLTNGQFGQPTVLGFAVFVTGLALAARHLDQVVAPPAAPSAVAPPRSVGPRRRSAYADRLHGPAAVAPAPHSNGSAGR